MPTPEAALEAFGAAEEREAIARENRARFDRLVKGGKARAAMLSREDIAQLAWGGAELMLLNIVTGRLKPKSAKEAADVAKALTDIARRELGEADTSIVIRTPEQREAAQSRAAELLATVYQRAGMEPPKALPAPAEPDDPAPVEPAVGAHPDADLAGSVAHPTVVGRALRTLPPNTGGT
jgi:hypothetical protein